MSVQIVYISVQKCTACFEAHSLLNLLVCAVTMYI